VLPATCLLVVTLCYAWLCWFKPFGHCRRCEGNGKTRRRTGRVWRRCKRCKGTGLRLRWGRRLGNACWRLYTEGTRPERDPQPDPTREPR
jgi:hypothetical protein